MSQPTGAADGRTEPVAADLTGVTRAMADSLKGLDELRYALDQAAIVATTDHRGIITYANDQVLWISKINSTTAAPDRTTGSSTRRITPRSSCASFGGPLRLDASGGVKSATGQRTERFTGVDTTIVPFLDGRGKPRHYLAIRSDITARKDAEAQLRQQSALTHLGQLAAVVAHEVRNQRACKPWTSARWRERWRSVPELPRETSARQSM